MQNPKIIPRKDEATAVEERPILFSFVSCPLTLRDPDRGHFDPHGDVRRSSSWRVARFILASDQRIPFFERPGRKVSFRGRMLCICIRHDESSSLADIPSFERLRTFSKGVVEKGEARTTLEGISSFEHG